MAEPGSLAALEKTLIMARLHGRGDELIDAGLLRGGDLAAGRDLRELGRSRVDRDVLVPQQAQGLDPRRRVPADPLRQSLARLGTIEAGKAADMVLLDANPLADISNLHKVSRIIHNGTVIDPKTLPLNPKFYKR